MSNDDVIAQLRAVDPAMRTDLSRIDPGALSALREGITMNATPSTTKARRLGRRGLFVAGVSVVLLGGGAAYAAHVEFFGGLADGVNCQHVWNETAAGAPEVTGPELTGDPIADCGTYDAQAGQPPVPDPVAFTYQGMLFVTPADQVPEGAVLRPASPTAAAARELNMSMADLVDGGGAQCFDQAGATAFATSELTRLGLTGWTVASDGGTNGSPCTGLWVEPDAQRVSVLPHRYPEPDVQVEPGGEVAGIRDALRAGITDACVNATDARAIADAALAELDYEPWPTTTVIDESVPCARVDMQVGGSIQVVVYGPSGAHD